MISNKQFSQATEFLSTYQDSLKCIEQIAEKKQGYAHYETTTGDLVSAMQNGQIVLQNGSVAGGLNKADFVFTRAHQNATALFQKFKFGSSGSRDEFVKSLNTALDKMSQ